MNIDEGANVQLCQTVRGQMSLHAIFGQGANVRGGTCPTLGQNIDYSKQENGPRASSAPALGLNTIIFKHVYWYMQQTQVSVYRTIGPLVMITVEPAESATFIRAPPA